MNRMAGTCIGSRSYDVAGPESYRCGSIQFEFRVRQKENVRGLETDLLADPVVTRRCLFLADRGIEKVLKQRSYIPDVGICK